MFQAFRAPEAVEYFRSSTRTDASFASGMVRADVRSNSGGADDDQTVRELRASEARYRALLHHMPTPLLQIDTRIVRAFFDDLRARGVTDIAAFLDENPKLIEAARDVVRVTEVNRAAVSLFRGRSAADLIKPVWCLFTTAPDMTRRIMIAHFEGRRNYTEQTRIFTFDGEALDVIFTITFPAPPEQLDTSFVTVLDMTERQRAETQLRRIQADHVHAARISTLGELATSIAHEVKQPLAAIITNAETSLRWLARDDVSIPKIKLLTTRIISSAHSANDIVQRIRSLAAKGETEWHMLDLIEVTDEALFFVRHDMEVNRIDLSIDAAAPLPKVLGDRIQLQQVIVNLLMNSIQAISQAAQPDRRIRLAIEPSEDGALTLSVHDSGPGIADQDLDQVFDSFFTTKKGGLGIGLAICQSIVAAHGGRISASNDSTGGALFQVALPAANISSPADSRPFEARR